MTNSEITKRVETLIKNIKEQILLNKKNNETAYYKSHAFDVNYDVRSIGHGLYAFGSSPDSNSYIDYTICVGKTRVIENLSKNDVISITKELYNALNNLKGTKGWGLLQWEDDDIWLNEQRGRNTIIKAPYRIVLLESPCKEFVSLKNYLSKYCNINITDTTLYSVGIGGKRGRVYGEEGDRDYLCHNAKRCTKFLEKLRESRGSKDTIKCKKNIKDYIDEWELKSSIINESEFSGSRTSQLIVTISTPKGKVKNEIEIF